MRKKHFLLLISCLLFLFSSILHPVQAEEGMLDTVMSEDAIVIDADTSQIIASKNADNIIYPASMTKIMTCIIAIESCTDLSQTVTITSEMLNGLKEANAAVAGFEVGDTPTIKDLLYAAMLPSGADAANALAYTVAESIANYTALMNQKAADIGMTHTHYTNVTGLHDDAHYSTVYDTALVLQYCLNNDTFKEVFTTDSYTTSALASAPDGITFSSTASAAAAKGNYQLSELRGAKTGFTNEAQHCMASWSEVNDMNIIVVTAHAESDTYTYPHMEDLNTIMTHLRSYHKQALTTEGNVLKTIQLQNLFTTASYDIIFPETLSGDLSDDAVITVEDNLPDSIILQNEEQTISVDLTIYVDDTVYTTDSFQCTIPKDTNILTSTVRRLIQLFQ